MSKAEYRDDVLQVLRELLEGLPDVQLGQMMGHPVFYSAPPGGKRKMFACVYGPGVALKLPPEQITELLEEPRCAPFAPMEKPMRGWVVISCQHADELRGDEELLQQALDCVSGGR